MKPIIGLALALALLTAACGSGDEATDGVASLEETTVTSTAETLPHIDQEQAVIALVQCLRDEGLEVSDPEVNADGNVDLRSLFRQAGEAQIDREAFQAGLDACEAEVAAVTIGFTRDFDLTEIQDQLIIFAQCMRDNGYDMDDPDLSNFGQPGGGGGPFGDIDPGDPDFIAANEACEDARPLFGGGGGGRP
jgi:hypothetical protein